MILRNARRQRTCAWLGLFAIVLLSIVPTLSQLRATTSGAHDAGMSHLALEGAAHAAMGHRCNGKDHHAAPANHDGKPCHKQGDDPWHKCGYCDFLTHAPALGNFEFVARFSTALQELAVPYADAQPVRAAYFIAARPRGPPHSV